MARVTIACELLLLILGCSYAANAAFNTSSTPSDIVLYYSQWAVYGAANSKGPPYNWYTKSSAGPGVTQKGDTDGAGAFVGRFYFLEDVKAAKNVFYSSGTASKIINLSFAGLDMRTCKPQTVDFFADMQVGVGGQCGPKGLYQWPGSADGAYGHACASKSLGDLLLYMSFGGWTMSTEFSKCTKDAAKKKAFIDGMKYFITKYNLKGIDIDWEYPGKQGCGGGADDPCKFVVNRNDSIAVGNAKRLSNPSVYSGPGGKGSPSSFIPVVPNTSSVTAEKDNAEQCHTGDPGVPYRLCSDSKLLADWVTDDCSSTCTDKNTFYNCAYTTKSCWKPMMNDCVEYFGHAITTNPVCEPLTSSIFQTVSGGSNVESYWTNGGYDAKNDWKNYVSLINDIKAAHNFPVTVALGMSDALIRGDISPTKMGTTYSAFCTAVNRANVMTYDFYGNWGAPYHNAPLFPDPSKNGLEGYGDTSNLAASVNNLIAAGCPASKINVGLAMYGRSYSGAAQKLGDFGLKGSSQNVGVGTYQKGVVSFWDIHDRFLPTSQGGDCDTNTDMAAANLPEELKQCGKWTRARDVTAGCVPYLYRDSTTGSGYDIISYDDEISIALKAKWARCTGVNGIMFWDSADDPDGTLSQAAWKAWAAVKSSDCPAILKAPTSCDGNTPTESPGTTETPTDSPVTTESPDQPGDCSDYKECVQECIDILD